MGDVCGFIRLFLLQTFATFSKCGDATQSTLETLFGRRETLKNKLNFQGQISIKSNTSIESIDAKIFLEHIIEKGSFYSKLLRLWHMHMKPQRSTQMVGIKLVNKKIYSFRIWISFMKFCSQLFEKREKNSNEPQKFHSVRKLKTFPRFHAHAPNEDEKLIS